MIFISYRITDSLDTVIHLERDLKREFGEDAVFRDMSGIQEGHDWPAALEENAKSRPVMLVIIGPAWQSAEHADGDWKDVPRLWNPDDWVRREITLAFDSGNIVIPVGLNDTAMPSEGWLANCQLERLSRYQAARLRARDYENDLRNLIAALRRDCPQLPPGPPQMSTTHKPCNLPDSIGTLFKGREAFLAELRAKLQQAGVKAAAISARKAIYGLGGIGKTQLAVEYGWAHHDDYTALLYLVAESPGLLLTNLSQLAGVLELPEREFREDDKRADAVLRWLNDHREWFLLIDNVDTDEAARAVIERLSAVHGGHVVITSRLARWPAHFEPLALDVLELDPAADYLLEAAHSRVSADDDREQARQIAEDVDGLALALTQAAGYIDKYRISFAEYRTRWHANIAKVADWHDPRVMTYPRSVAVTWNTTVARLTGPARTLLELLSFLAPEPIPRDLITGESSKKPFADTGIPEPEEALTELADVSMLKLDGEGATMHRLVTEVTRHQIAVEESENRLRSILAAVDDYRFGADPHDVRSWPRWISMAGHVAALVDRADAAGITQPTGRLMNNLGLFLANHIRFAEAEQLYRRTLAIDEESVGPWHPNVASCLGNLAGLLRDMNRLAEAEPLYRRALTISEKNFGPEHPNVARSLNNLALVLHATNRLAEAESHLRRALAIDEVAFGPDHPSVAIHLNNLAELLRAAGRLPDAELLCRRALSIAEKDVGPRHPHVGRSLNNLALVLHGTGRPAEAEPLYRRALAIVQECLYPEHPNVAAAFNNLDGHFTSP